MTAKLQNAEPLMAPDLRVKAMKEAYAGRGAAARQCGSAAAVGDWIGRDSLGATMAYVCIRPYIHTSMHTYIHIYIHTHIIQARGNGKTSIVKLNIS